MTVPLFGCFRCLDYKRSPTVSHFQLLSQSCLHKHAIHTFSPPAPDKGKLSASCSAHSMPEEGRHSNERISSEGLSQSAYDGIPTLNQTSAIQTLTHHFTEWHGKKLITLQRCTLVQYTIHLFTFHCGTDVHLLQIQKKKFFHLSILFWNFIISEH